MRTWQEEPHTDESWLGELLERATAGEPPMGPLALNSLRAGLRRRRRVRGGAACAAGAAVICAAVLAVTETSGTGASGTPGAAGTIPQTVYVLSANGTVTPISTVTNTPGKPIAAGWGAQFMALTPNGQTLYVADLDTVMPIATATNTPGKPIKVGSDGSDPTQILVTPDGQTAYVANFSGVTPISTATNTPEKPPAVGSAGQGSREMAITPDGKTLYFAIANTLIPISTATNTPGKPILLRGQTNSGSPDDMIMTPDGSTLYVYNDNEPDIIVPVSTATNTSGQPIPIAADPGFAAAMAPDGKTLYVVTGNDGNAVVPISTATNTPGKPISVPSGADDIVFTPDGQTAYVASQCPPGALLERLRGCTGPRGEVTPISTATNTPGTPVQVSSSGNFGGIYSLAITPDGKTIYVISGNGNTVTPITTATNTPGKPIKVEDAQSIVITHNPMPLKAR